MFKPDKKYKRQNLFWQIPKQDPVTLIVEVMGLLRLYGDTYLEWDMPVISGHTICTYT